MTGKLKYRLFAFLTGLVIAAGAAGISASAEDNGEMRLRVLLRRLNIGQHMEIKTGSLYLITGESGMEMLLQPDTQIDIELRENRMVVFLDGASLSFGKTMSLNRCGTGGQDSGLYLMNASGLYPGDLVLTAEEGKIRPVISLALEDYLLGVVPYEMNDSFPPEALKAQAVCARTYAVRHMNRTRDYDVVDTTNDQVFKGVSASNKNAAKAVSDTAGIVVTVNGKIADGFYSASNGGQTEIPENVWKGKTDADCYAVVDDPWDLANPDSLTRSAVLMKDGTGLYRWMTRLIREAVFSEDAWISGGFTGGESEFRIDRIESVSLKKPKYAAPSRLYTEMEMKLDVSGRKVTGGTIGPFIPAGSFTITLKLFPDVLAALGIEISGNGNEIVTVNETKTLFQITAGRYGHGVGLSQRGAQWMASEGKKSFEEIIRFYFPGSELRKMNTQDLAPVSVPEILIPHIADESEEIEPAPQATLMPVTDKNIPDGAYMASVEGIDDGSTLNLRSRPSMASQVVMRLIKHQHLIVLDELDVPGWAHVKTDAAEGYVMSSYLQKLKTGGK